jgi:hypothetical protein
MLEILSSFASKAKSSLVYKIDEDRNLDTFEMVANTNEPTKELVN